MTGLAGISKSVVWSVQNLKTTVRIVNCNVCSSGSTVSISGEIPTPSIVAVTVANQGRDIRDLEPGIFEKLLCFFHTVFRQVLVQSLTSFTLKKGTHIRSRQEDVFVDIFDGKRLMHIILTDIIFDQKDGWIFL